MLFKGQVKNIVKMFASLTFFNLFIISQINPNWQIFKLISHINFFNSFKLLLILIDIISFFYFTLSAARSFKKTVQNETKDFEKINDIPDFNESFQDKKMDLIVNSINKKINKLNSNPLLQQDVASLLMIEKIKTEYLYEIHKNYFYIPVHKGGNMYDKDSPYSLTLNQLNLILEGLDHIKSKLHVEDLRYEIKQI